MLKKNSSKDEKIQTSLPKESISLKAVFIFLGLIFVLLLIMVFYLRYSSWSPFYDYYAKKTLPSASFTDLYNKNKSASSLKTVDLKITESDLSNTIGVEKDSFPLKKATLKIKPEGIVLSGKTSNAFWGVPVEVLLTPRTGNGKLLIQVREIKAGGVVAPPKIAGQLTPPINTLFSQAFLSLDKLNIQEARTFVGFLMLEIEG